MASAAPQPLTLDEAKARLRTAAADIEADIGADIGALALTSLEPRRAVLLALLAGVLVGTSPDARKTLAKVLVGLLSDFEG